MALAFDTLGYARQLRDRGIPQDQAEAHAEAARDFIMAELVTKTDLQLAIGHVDAKFGHVDAKFGHFDAKFAQFEAKFAQLEAKLDNLSLRLTVRLGVMLVAAIAALAAIIKL